MPDGEEPVVEPTLESLHAYVKAQSTLLRELATALAQLTAPNEYLKQDDRRLPAQEEYLWMCFGAHMAALFVALDELLLPYVPAASQDFTPYLARARNHAKAIDKAFRFRLSFLRRLNEVKRVHDPQELRRQTFSVRFFCHDSENIGRLEATTATVVWYVAWIGERGHIGAKSLQPYLSAINTFFELHNLDPIAKDSLHLAAARRGLMLRQRRLEAAPLRIPLPDDVAYSFVEKAELIVSAPTIEYQHDFRARVASVVNFMFFARGLIGVSCRADTRVGEAEMRHRHGKVWPCDSHQRHPKAPDGLTWLRVSA
eukprot:jgi/Tetstr1/433230/TSEL_022518.t1